MIAFSSESNILPYKYRDHVKLEDKILFRLAYFFLTLVFGPIEPSFQIKFKGQVLFMLFPFMLFVFFV